MVKIPNKRQQVIKALNIHISLEEVSTEKFLLTKEECLQTLINKQGQKGGAPSFPSTALAENPVFYRPLD